MWNRVFLLASGFLFGWALVRYWTVPRAQMATHALRLGLGLAVGAAVILLLGLESLAAAVAGLAVYGFSAVVAYAGNARQVSRASEPTPLPRPEPQALDGGRQGVVLVSCLEPPAYQGPDYWAWRLWRRESRGGAVPHWFLRPRTYARIRSAYWALEGDASPDGSPPPDALRRAADDLEAVLGDGYRVAASRVHASPLLARALADLAHDGVTRVTVQPLEVPADAADGVREAVTHSRVREVGVRIAVNDPLAVPAWAGLDERLDDWMAGRPPEPPPDLDASTLECLSRLVAQER